MHVRPTLRRFVPVCIQQNIHDGLRNIVLVELTAEPNGEPHLVKVRRAPIAFGEVFLKVLARRRVERIFQIIGENLNDISAGEAISCHA